MIHNFADTAASSHALGYAPGKAVGLVRGTVAHVGGPISRTFERAAAVVIVMVGAVIAGGVDDAQAFAAPTTYAASSAFCTAVFAFGANWPQVNLDVPGQPFFSDGNNDGIADLLQVGRGRLPSLASELDALAGQAPPGLQGGLHTLAGDVTALAGQSAPASAEQSRQQVGPIERAAGTVQRDLRTAGCRAEPAGTTPFDESDGSESGSGNPGRISVVVFLFVLLNFPLIRRVWRHLRRPGVRNDGSRFRGNLRRWKIQTVTGRVLDVRTRSVTTTRDGYVSPDGVVTPPTSFTTTYETIRLALADGRRTDETLVDFMASPSDDDIVTVCVGRKRSKAVRFALLNHTTGQRIVQDQSLFTLREGGSVRQSIFVLGLIFGSLLSMIIAVFGGALWLVAVWLGLMAAFVIGARRGRSIDLQPLWRRARAESQALLA